VVYDGAGRHQQGKRLLVPDTLTLLLLPLYCLRGNQLGRGIWDRYEAIVAPCKNAWLCLISDHARIHSIAHQPVWVNL